MSNEEEMAAALRLCIEYMQSITFAWQVDAELAERAHDEAHCALSNYENKQKETT